MKKILIITGSPRPNGNSNTLVKAFASGAIAAGHEVEIFDAPTAKMDGCHGDGSCEQRGACGLKDAGQKMHEYLRWADTLVFASPVYWNGFTSQVKKCIDRLYPYSFEKGRATLAVKSAYLLSTATVPSMDMFDGVKATFSHVCKMLNIENAGMLCFPGLKEPDAIKEHPEYLETVIKAAYSIEK